MDTVIKHEKELLSGICNAIKPGAVFLFHDTSITTLNVLQEFINVVKNKGYRVVPLDKMLHLEPYA
jgi:peptidoglycan/xylan/chitin deacetylase (PgdA/CDA1 family)